ncbi:MAG: head GIN domain-containing protein [Bacteroidota bacterium]
MVKFIVFCTKIVATTIAAALFSSCHARDIQIGDGIDGNGNVTTQTRNVDGNFTKIEASRGLNVTLEQASSHFIEVEADENLQEHITTTVENGTLIITSDENIDEATAKNIRVKLPSLSSVETTSGSSVTTKNTFSGTDITVKSSSGSESNLSLEYDNISCESSSGSHIAVKGKALKLKTDSSSGSEIEAHGLLVNEVISESTSGSSTQVHPLVNLKAKASSGSSIDYDGSPKTVSKEESSGGSVSKE